MQSSDLAVMTQRRNLDVTAETYLKTSAKSEVACKKKANKILGVIKKGTENKTKSIIMPLNPWCGHILDMACSFVLHISKSM